MCKRLIKEVLPRQMGSGVGAAGQRRGQSQGRCDLRQSPVEGSFSTVLQENFKGEVLFHEVYLEAKSLCVETPNLPVTAQVGAEERKQGGN